MKHFFTSISLLLALACGFTPAYAAKDKDKKEDKGAKKEKGKKDKKAKDEEDDENALDKRQYGKLLKELKPLMGNIKTNGKFFMFVGVNTLTEDGEARIKKLLEIQAELKKARTSLIVIDYTPDEEDAIVKAYKKLKAKLPVVLPEKLRVKHPDDEEIVLSLAPNVKEADVSICEANGKPVIVSNGSLLDGWHKYVGAKPAPVKKKKEAGKEAEEE